MRQRGHAAADPRICRRLRADLRRTGELHRPAGTWNARSRCRHVGRSSERRFGAVESGAAPFNRRRSPGAGARARIGVVIAAREPSLRCARCAARGRGPGRAPLRPWLRAGASARVAHVAFGEAQAWHQAAGVQLTLDTRIDPSFPRNAVHATARRRSHPLRGRQRRAHVRGCPRLRGHRRLHRPRASRPRPPARIRRCQPSEQMLLGGIATLRGYRAGHRAGDGLAPLSAEVRMPLTSPLNVGRFGVKAFVDAGTTWDAGAAPRDQQLRPRHRRQVSTSAPTALTANVDVAWPETGKPRVHAGGSEVLICDLRIRQFANCDLYWGRVCHVVGPFTNFDSDSTVRRGARRPASPPCRPAWPRRRSCAPSAPVRPAARSALTARTARARPRSAGRNPRG